MMLCSLGMCCEVASNGQEAVAAVKRRIGREDLRQFDVLLMDMAMPVMGGVDATKVVNLLMLRISEHVQDNDRQSVQKCFTVSHFMMQ